MISNKIKNLIFEFLLKDLTKVEIIYYRDSIWFIDRENRYWYFEYHKVDKHLWWRWTHFTQALKIFSMDGEKEQSIFGELVNMILTKKQKLEAKYPNKIFKTVGSVMNFEDEVNEVLNCEVKTTCHSRNQQRVRVDDILNYKVETAYGTNLNENVQMNEVLNCEVDTTIASHSGVYRKVDEVLNYEVKTTKRAVMDYIDEVDEVLAVDIEKIDYSKTHRLRPVTGALDYNDNPVEIKSIRKLKGESPLQDIIVSHILDESDKVTDKLKMKEDDYVKTYSHDVYMCDHLVQNVLDIGVNSIHYDTHNHQPIVDGILKKA